MYPIFRQIRDWEIHDEMLGNSGIMWTQSDLFKKTPNAKHKSMRNSAIMWEIVESLDFESWNHSSTTEIHNMSTESTV